MLLPCFNWLIKKWFNALISFISTNGIQHSSKKFLGESASPFLNESTNNLLVFLNIDSIKQSKLLLFVCAVILDLYWF